MIQPGHVLYIYKNFANDPYFSTSLIAHIISRVSFNCDTAFLYITSYSPDTIVLGANQNKKDFLVDKAKEEGIKVVKRHTGGLGYLLQKMIFYTIYQ